LGTFLDLIRLPHALPLKRHVERAWWLFFHAVECVRHDNVWNRAVLERISVTLESSAKRFGRERTRVLLLEVIEEATVQYHEANVNLRGARQEKVAHVFEQRHAAVARVTAEIESYAREHQQDIPRSTNASIGGYLVARSLEDRVRDELEKLRPGHPSTGRHATSPTLALAKLLAIGLKSEQPGKANRSAKQALKRANRRNK
jgi:hypothetical protein